MCAQQVLGVKVRLVEPIMLRGRGEFGPGSWVKGTSLILPTTLYGALAHRGWLLNRQCSEGVDRWEALRRCLAVLLGSEACRAELRGPALLAGGKVLVGCAEGLAELSPEGINEWVRRQDRGERPGKRAGDVPHRFVGLSELLTRRTGVGLAKPLKTVEEGLIYTAPYTDYRVGKLLEPLTRSGRKEALIVADIVANAELSVSEAPIPVRLGGEDRKALAYLSSEPKILPILEKLWKGITANTAIVVLATPLILDSNALQAQGLEALLSEDLDRLALKAVSKAVEGIAAIHEARVYSIHPRVRPRFTLLQLGFDERLRRKLSLRPALMPGAAFKVRLATGASWKDLYLRPHSYLSEVGFGTFLPIPLLE